MDGIVIFPPAPVYPVTVALPPDTVYCQSPSVSVDAFTVINIPAVNAKIPAIIKIVVINFFIT
ncbi:MAG: hypothetical protein FWD90_09605 [Defluviitaleaceae bacterium]|nr:hypothetical protein [Defluviitaleaceae bacterium]